MSFCTAINCMDGRVQDQVASHLRERFQATWVDTITAPGVVRLLAEGPAAPEVAGLVASAEISVLAHSSGGLAVVAHHDCAGNPVPAEVQCEQVRASVGFLRERFPLVTVVGLWVGADWTVEELDIEP